MDMQSRREREAHARAFEVGGFVEHVGKGGRTDQASRLDVVLGGMPEVTRDGGRLFYAPWPAEGVTILLLDDGFAAPDRLLLVGPGVTRATLLSLLAPLL